MPVVFLLVCVLIGWLVGYPLIGLLVGLVLCLCAAAPYRRW